MDPENLFLNGSHLNVEKLIREKKISRFCMIWAAIGAIMGVSSSLVFFFHYKLVLTPCFSLLASFIALTVVYLEIQFIRDVWTIWTYQLKYWYYISLCIQAICVIGVIAFIILGIVGKQAVTVESDYVTSVWVFVCWKWSFMICHRTKKFRKMFTRYSLISADSEDISSE